MKKVLLRAPIYSTSGYGEDARVILRALLSERDKFDLYIMPIKWGNTSWMFEDTSERKLIDSLVSKTEQTAAANGGKLFIDISIQNTIPNEFQKVASVNIGVTAGCETTRIPPSWVEKCNLMDKIIVHSEFTKNVLLESTFQAQNKQTGQVFNDYKIQVPIEVVHFPSKPIEPKELNMDFGCDFNFLMVSQLGAIRKNIENTVKWFIEEFYDFDNIGLVLKINLVNNSIVDRYHTERRLKTLLNEYKKRSCKVHLLHGYLTEEELAGLYTHKQIKAFINNSFGEGSCIPALEAATYDLPIVTYNWSGHTDFLNMPIKDKNGNVKSKPMFAKVDYDLLPIQKEAIWPGVLEEGSRWAYTKSASFKMKLRSMYKNYGSFQAKARKLGEHVREQFSEEKIYNKYSEIFGEYADDEELVNWLAMLNDDIKEV